MIPQITKWLLGVLGMYASETSKKADSSVVSSEVVSYTTPPAPSPNSDSFTPPWDTAPHNWHNVRVLCDKSGLTVEEKNLVCSCIYQESRFLNYYLNGSPVIHQNLNEDKTVSSTDFGIAQINDYWHVIKYKDFPSTDYILANPDKAVQFMIDKYKAGQLRQWSSYATGANQQWLSTTSPMWLLAT